MESKRKLLEQAIELQYGIESFERKIFNRIKIIDTINQLFSDTELIDEYNNDIDTYKRCIKRLEQRFNNILKEL